MSDQASKTSLRERAKKLVEQMTLEEKVSQIISDSPGLERLGIEKHNFWNECIHGITHNPNDSDIGKATCFPMPLGMAASWNTDLMYKVGTAISTEARAKYNMGMKGLIIALI